MTSTITSRFERLATLIEEERNTLLAQWRAQVSRLPSAQGLDTPTIEDHVPALLDDLANCWRTSTDKTIADTVLAGNSAQHGRERFRVGFDLGEVVAEYSILRGCIFDLGERHNVSLHDGAFHILNRVFDGAIGAAVQTFATQQALEITRRREEYLAFVAHDLRTPLRAISLATQALTRELLSDGKNPTVVRMLKTLHRNERRLEKLVESVLKETGQVGSDAGVKVAARPFDLWPLVASVMNDLGPVADTCGAQLVNEVPDELEAYGDAELVRRILQNLIANALNYTARGAVTVGARRADQAGTVECWVRDNGSGIPESRMAKIFENGGRDGSDDEAPGLGLPIVKAFVEAHGGSVTVSSKEGHGTIFLFTLPRAASETRPATRASDGSR